MPKREPKDSRLPEPPSLADPQSLSALAERVARIEQHLENLEARIGGGSLPEEVSSSPAEASQPFDLEHRFASPLLNYLGLLTLLVGLALLIGLWMESRPWMAIVLACLAAVALAGMGEWMRRRGSQTFSLTLEGSALGLIYIACYLSHVWGGILLSLLAGALVMVLAMSRALQRNSQLVATFALLAALLGPLLLRSVHSGESLLFGYLAAVNAGAVWAGRRKGWTGLRFLALLGSHVVAWFWYWTHPTAQPALTAAFPILTFILFAGVVPPGPLTLAEAALGTVNSVAFLAASVSLFQAHLPVLVAWTPLLLAGLHLLWGLSRWYSQVYNPYSVLHGWLAAILFAVGLVFPMPTVVVAVGWTAQGLFLGWMGTRNRRILWRGGGNLLGLGAAFAVILALRSPQENLPPSLSVLVVVAFCLSVLLRHRWVRRCSMELGNWEWAAHWLLAVLATVLPMLVLGRLRGALPVSLAPQLVTSLLWAGYSVALCLVGWFWYSAFLRWIGVALLVLTTLKVFLVDPVALSGFSRTLSFLVLSLFLLLLSYLFQTRRG